jgi:hypothetical protein
MQKKAEGCQDIFLNKFLKLLKAVKEEQRNHTRRRGLAKQMQFRRRMILRLRRLTCHRLRRLCRGYGAPREKPIHPIDLLGTKVERVVLRKGAWLPRSFTLNALADRCGFAAY